ncbi:hypothetical protein I2485_07340 [Nesterenkonia sp. E16_7]|uniref:ComF family protein n=1 Tax=unclassified Nesterenkonia TaxID=2629769 RepID=UPI001A916D2C|nr:MULTISPECIES: phosphoribosyltransferase family protein [unclassified Nesterenkonia]MBO0594325.1 hypothetical protein [Nesterenkonia sp. E16_10]MBO0598465.1 hypothetical protein [Nesterenkonia sp. E16_7]
MSSMPQRPARLAGSVDRIWFGPTGVAVRTALRGAAGLVSPVWCIGCAEQDVVLCAPCAEELHLATRMPFPAEEQALALPLLFERQGFTVLPVSAAGRYEGLLARAVLGFKDHGAIGLSAALGPGLARALRLAAARALAEPGAGPAAKPGGLPDWLLVSPPPSLRSRLTRGFDPVQLLLDRALAISEPELLRIGVRPMRVPGLLRASRAAALSSLNPRHGRQKTRGARARRRRSVGSIELTPRGRSLIPGAQVLLVDDVLTSGSTLAELHRVLTASGAQVHGAAVFAAAPGPGVGSEFQGGRASPEA